jgi:hypothetical protein
MIPALTVSTTGLSALKTAPALSAVIVGADRL